jgi:glycosyltransferase involved in cell wall biosynthesis
VKVLHVIPSVAVSRGGASQAVLQLLPALQTQGVVVELVTTNDDSAGLLAVPLWEQIDYQGIPTRFFPRFSPNLSAVREFAFSADLTTWLWRHIAEYDLVHVHALFSYASTAAMAIARMQRVPYLNQPHGLLCQWSLQQGALKKRLYLQTIERANLNHSRGLQLTTEMERREVQALGLQVPTEVVPLGLDLASVIPQARQRLRSQLNLPDGEPIILFLSRLHPKKGLDYLITALGQLKSQPFTFVIAGNGAPSYEQEITQWIEQAGIQDRTRRLGFVTGELKELLLQAADIFALTSYSENFGVVVLEAMAAGLAIVLTPGVALAEMVQQQQLGYVPNLTVAEISDALGSCLQHLDQARGIGQRARQFIIEHYTWDSIAKQMIQSYQKVLSPSSMLYPKTELIGQDLCQPK